MEQDMQLCRLVQYCYLQQRQFSQTRSRRVKLPMSIECLLCFFFLIFYLFMRDTEREKEAEARGRGRSRLHAGSPTWDSIPGLQDQSLG